MVKKVIIGVLLILLVLMLSIYFSMPFLVDKEAISNEFTSGFKMATGLDIEISGDVVVKTFPAPHVVINSLYVHNAPGGLSSFLLSIKLVELWPTYTSFFSKQAKIASIRINDVDIELERLKSGHMNWEDSTVQTSVPASFSGLSGDSGLAGTAITLTNGYLRYVDEETNASSEYKDIAVDVFSGGESESVMKAGFRFKDRNITASGKIGNLQQAISAGEMPANLNIVSGKSALTYAGSIGYKNKKLSVSGKAKFETDDIGSWISTVLSNNATENAGTNDDAQEQPTSKYKLLPLLATSSITTENGKIIFPDLALDGAIIKGGAHVEISPADDVSIKALINTLDLESLFDSKFFAESGEGRGADQNKNDHTGRDSGIGTAQKSAISFLNLSADLTFGDALYNGQHIKDSHIQLDTAGGEMTISQAAFTLPGDGRLVFAGIGKQGFQGFTLEGEVDASGADFAETVKVLKANGAAIPVQDFKRYRIKANAALSAKELRLSELTARIENMAFVGGIIATFGDRIKLDAAMRIGGVNLDHFIQIWGIQEWRTSLFDVAPDAKYDSFLARWLRRLDYDAVMNISFEQFLLNGTQREKAEFRLTTGNGKASLDNIKTTYNGTQLTGNFTLDLNNTLPKMDINVVADTFDTATFFTADGKPEPSSTPPQATTQKTSRWSHQPFDFHWLELMNLTFHFKFGQYRQGLVTAQDLDVQGTDDGRILTVESFTGKILGAQVVGKASIRGGKIPSVNLATNIVSLDPDQLLPFLPVLEGLTGKFSLSLRLDASGIDMFSWISSLEGSVGVGGEHINVRGFNIAAVIHAISYVRTVADILNVVKRAFPGGDSMFTSAEGQWTVANGVCKTANLQLVNEDANGSLSGQVDLPNWQMQTAINLSLKTLDSAHPPSMSVTFNGDIDRPDIALDTRSLEQYVTNKTSQRMLQEYGTH